MLKVNRKKYHFLKLRPSPILKRFLEVESILNFSGACLFKPTWKYFKLFLEALRGKEGRRGRSGKGGRGRVEVEGWRGKGVTGEVRKKKGRKRGYRVEGK